MGREPTCSTNVRAEEQPSGLTARASRALAFFVGVDTPRKPVLSVDEVAELDPPIGFTLDRGDCPPRLPGNHHSKEEVDRQHRADRSAQHGPWSSEESRSGAGSGCCEHQERHETEQQCYAGPCGSYDGACAKEGANDERKVLELWNVRGYLRHLQPSSSVVVGDRRGEPEERVVEEPEEL